MTEFKQIASIADRLRTALEVRDMKQVELSSKTGLPPSAISRYLSGEYEPKNKPIYELAKALDVSEQWLMGYDTPMERPQMQKNNDAIADIVLRMQTDDLFLSFVKAANELEPEKLSSLLTFLK